MSDLPELTPLKDLKPQLVCVGKVLGMDLYIDMLRQPPEKYELAQKLFRDAFYPKDDEAAVQRNRLEQ